MAASRPVLAVLIAAAIPAFAQEAPKEPCPKPPGAEAGKAKRVKRGLNGTRAALLRFVTLVQRLQPKHITDPLAVAALTTAAAQALLKVEALQTGTAG